MKMNVANRLAALAQSQPDTIAVAEPLKKYVNGKREYKTITYRELNELSDRIARGVLDQGVKPGMRIALLVRPGVDFVASVFGLLKSGAVMILIDPGMGGRNLLKCLQDSCPDGFFAIPAVQALRCLLFCRFPKAKYNITAGRRWFWGGTTLDRIKAAPYPGPQMADTEPDDLAAIIFTTGSTGPSKGVGYTHETFETQVSEIAKQYNIQPGQVDLPGFPMFGLFNCAMGSTAVLPDLDASRPASVDPRNIIEAVRDWNVTQSFGSPAIWKKVGAYCQKTGQRLNSVRMILSAGAPVQEPVLQSMVDCICPGGVVHTPYGATEALPVATIDSNTLLSETSRLSREGKGTCVGNHFPSIQWKVIRTIDGPIADISQIEELPRGEIGELIVFGPQITRRYETRQDANKTGKIPDGDRVWHRMGDVGYLDDKDRFWFCGRMAHRVCSETKTYYTIPTEAIFLNCAAVNRAALVGIGEPYRQKPVMIIEPKDQTLCSDSKKSERLLEELAAIAKTSALTADIETFLLHPSFPVDIRHNAKIFREKLAVWAAKFGNKKQ